jgi:hypothetical protein
MRLVRVTAMTCILGAGLLLTVGTRFAGAYNHVECGGNASATVDIEFENGCYIAYNRSQKNVKFGFGNVSFVVGAGGHGSPKNLNGTCIQQFVGKPWADYA